MTPIPPVHQHDETPVAPQIAPGMSGLVAMSERFAAIPAGEAERLIEAYVVQAISQWRVADATFWQRVKFRARLIRATERGREVDRAAGKPA